MRTKGDGEETRGARVQALPLGEETYAVICFPLEEEVAEGLTAAESEVARLAIDGLSNEAIAKVRGTSVRTVANQLAAIYEKVGVNSRAELAARRHLCGES